MLLKTIHNLKQYCESEQYKGWDPYDGLNSRLLMSIPGFKNSSLYRLVIIQFFKRCPINFRRFALVPKEYNAKGIGLLLQGYCNLLYAVNKKQSLAIEFGSVEEIKSQIHNLATLLISLRSQGDYHGACWGYNFDWQARLSFIFPKFTPTVVATSFCAKALISAYEATGKKEYLDVALSSAQFVINDLHRTNSNGGFLFSYSPLKGNDTVYNASLLGSELLSCCYKYTREEKYKELARLSVNACCRGQQENGAWLYGKLPIQNWVDSFHTGYNLVALNTYQQFTGDTSFKNYISKGLYYYLNNFFETDGAPKYYDDKKYPIDIHCPAQLFVTLSRLDILEENKELANKVLKWTINNMQSPKGYFYYQIKPFLNSRISYMRWSNAFMFNALTYYLLKYSEN